MNISVEQVKKLIEDYWVYERECRESSGEIAYTRAALYRTVIMDLEKLLPRKSMADVASEMWPKLVGAWVEHDGVNKVIFEAAQRGEGPIGLFYPKSGETVFVNPEHAFLTDHDAAWDTEGSPV